MTALIWELLLHAAVLEENTLWTITALLMVLAIRALAWLARQYVRIVCEWR